MYLLTLAHISGVKGYYNCFVYRKRGNNSDGQIITNCEL